jgi:hypothetical protein
MNIAYPLHIASNGRTAVSDSVQHINDMIQQVLFTIPGERVNLLTFGSGLSQAVFAPNGADYAATYQALIQGALQQWLGNLIRVQSLQVTSEDATLQLTLQYVILATQQQQTEQFNLTF